MTPANNDPLESRLAELRSLMSKYFSKGEVRTLAFDLGIDYDELAGETKSEKIVSLVQYAQTHNKLEALLNQCKKLRDFVKWPDLYNTTAVAAAPSTANIDIYSRLEIGLHRLGNSLNHAHPRHGDYLTLQHRLTENIGKTRRHGDNESASAVRAEIIDQLNQLALQTINVSFNQLCS